jgi:hypothetical protein
LGRFGEKRAKVGRRRRRFTLFALRSLEQKLRLGTAVSKKPTTISDKITRLNQKETKQRGFRLPSMKRQITVRVDNKAYDITLSDQAGEAIPSAIEELKALGENVGVKRLLEAYLSKAALADRLYAELKDIEKTIAAEVCDI